MDLHDHSNSLKGIHFLASTEIKDAILFLEDSKYIPKDVAMTQKCLSEVGQIKTFLVMAS